MRVVGIGGIRATDRFAERTVGVWISAPTSNAFTPVRGLDEIVLLVIPGILNILVVVISNFPTMEAIMGDLVRIKEKYQVTIPARLREEVHLHTGDYLEASVYQDGILLRPKRLADAPKRRPSILAFLHETRSTTRTREEIDAALAADRSSWDR